MHTPVREACFSDLALLPCLDNTTIKIIVLNFSRLYQTLVESVDDLRFRVVLGNKLLSLSPSTLSRVCSIFKEIR